MNAPVANTKSTATQEMPADTNHSHLTPTPFPTAQNGSKVVVVPGQMPGPVNPTVVTGAVSNPAEAGAMKGGLSSPSSVQSSFSMGPHTVANSRLSSSLTTFKFLTPVTYRNSFIDLEDEDTNSDDIDNYYEGINEELEDE